MKIISNKVKDALKARAKRPRKRYYSAQGVKDILKICSKIDLDKSDLHVDWEELIKRYDQGDYDNEEEEYKKLPLEEDSEDDSDTGSMIGLGKYTADNRRLWA